MPNVDVILTSNSNILAQTKTGADGRAVVRVGRGLFIHPSDWVHTHRAGCRHSIHFGARSRHQNRVRPRVQETVSVQASTEDISEQTSSPGESIKPEEANES